MKNVLKEIVGTIVFLLLIYVINKLMCFLIIDNSITRLVSHEAIQSENLDCIFIGQSHFSYGVNTQEFETKTGLKSMNFSLGSENTVDMYYYLLKMLEKSNPKIVVFDLDYNYLTKNKLKNPELYNNYPLSIKKLRYTFSRYKDENIFLPAFSWISSRGNIKDVNKNIKMKRTSEYKLYKPESLDEIETIFPQQYIGKGYIYKTDGVEYNYIFKEKNNVNDGKFASDADNEIYYLNKINQLCKFKNIHFVLVTTPVNLKTLEPYEEYEKLDSKIKNIIEKENIEYYNFNFVKPEKYTRYDDDYFDFDGHMYGRTSIRWTNFLAEFINKLLYENIDRNEYFYNSLFEYNKENNN